MASNYCPCGKQLLASIYCHCGLILYELSDKKFHIFQKAIVYVTFVIFKLKTQFKCDQVREVIALIAPTGDYVVVVLN